MTLRIAIVDDEPLARERLRMFLADHADCEVVGEAGDGTSALELIESKAPALVFLDVQMPELDGFDVVAALPADLHPAVVFVTAFDRYALDAFEVNAVDYLLKPIERERFARALARARDRIGRAEADPGLQPLLALMRRDRVRFVSRDRRGYYFVAADDVDWVAAEGNYVALHAGGKPHLVRESLRSIEERLDPATFVRIHRSALVNVGSIDRIEPYGGGAYAITLRDGTRLTSSRGHGESLRRRLQLKG